MPAMRLTETPGDARLGLREVESPRPRMARCHARKRPLGATSPGVEEKMHPGMLAWWHAHRPHGGCGNGECGPEAAFAQGHHGGGPWGWRGGGGGGGGQGGGDEFGAGFGVRRPLRFLAFKLDLDDSQTTALAAILNELKTERAQAAVDHRRTTSALADVVAADTFDAERAKAAAGDRVKSAELVETMVTAALGRIHALLRPEQRAKLAYLLRTGALSM